RAVLAKDPFAAALFSHSIMRAINYALLGIEHAQGEEVGIFGKVEAVHWNSEEQNRGSLHWHGLLWLANKPNPRDFAALLSSTKFQHHIFTYLDSIILQQPPALCANGMFRNPESASVDAESYHCPLKKTRKNDHPALTRPSDPSTFKSD